LSVVSIRMLHRELDFKSISLMLGVNELGVEHWVGGILEFARLWNEQDPYPQKRGLLRLQSFEAVSEDDF
jgi:hypothetical protein